MKAPASFIIVLLVMFAAFAFVGARIDGAKPAPRSSEVQSSLPLPTQQPDPPQPPRLEAAVIRIRAEQIGLDAPVITMGADDAGAMETPPGPQLVAWYDFSAKPGGPGNAVLSGHVDYANWGPAVFWRLKDLSLGSAILIELADGTVYEYVVRSWQRYEVATAPLAKILGSSSEEVITLITCAGSFDPAKREYDEVFVVRAVRKSATPS
jgi:LPXTG-site transpeptidase (sortase) family protein